MTVVYLLLLVVAAVLFALAASNRISSRVNLVAAGLFCWVLVAVLQMVQRV